MRHARLEITEIDKNGNQVYKSNDEIIKEYERLIRHNNEPIINYEKHLQSFNEDLIKLDIAYKKYYTFFENNFEFTEKIETGFFKNKTFYEIRSTSAKRDTLKELGKSYTSIIENIDKNFIIFEDILNLFGRDVVLADEDSDFVSYNYSKNVKSAYERKTPLGNLDYGSINTFDGIFLPEGQIKLKNVYHISRNQCTDNTLKFFDELLPNIGLDKYSKRIELDLPRVLSENGAKKYFQFRVEHYEKKKRKYELIKRRIESAEKKIENIGYVYVLSNKAYPNIYKIGSTYGNAEERAEELTGTGHLMPFKVETKIKIKSAEYYEKKIHSVLNSYRVKQNREFFELDLKKIKSCLKTLSQITDKGEKKLSLSELKKEINV